MGGEGKSGGGKFLGSGKFLQDRTSLLQLVPGGVTILIRTGRAAFLRAGVAAGLLNHRGHQLLEVDQVEHAFEIVGQGGQAPFRLHLGQPFQ